MTPSLIALILICIAGGAYVLVDALLSPDPEDEGADHV